MKILRISLLSVIGLVFIPAFISGQSLDVQKLETIRLQMYPAEGLVWKGESTQNTNWNKITETPDGRIWFSGGDHWGTDGIYWEEGQTGPWEEDDRYERPWGFGNTTINYYDPELDRAYEEVELNRVSGLYSNAETPGHGKIHSNIVSDSEGNLFFAGYMGHSYTHENTAAYFPKSYAGGALIKYDPATGNHEYLGIPAPFGASVALYYDEQRNILNGLTVDRQIFWRLNLDTMELNRYESRSGGREMIMDRNGFSYFLNPHGGLTQFNPDTEEFADMDVELPGGNFRATVVSSENIIYGVSHDGFVWSFDTKTRQVEDLGHVIGRPDQSQYTPNIALDEEWERLYFIAGNHGRGMENTLATLTILDLRTKKYHWIGRIKGVEGCFGALVSSDHSVYFNSYGDLYQDGNIVTLENGGPVTRPYLVRYDPPEDLESLLND